MKKAAIILLTALLITTFVSCNKGGTESEVISDTASIESKAPTALVPHLEKRDLDGFTLTFMIAGEEGSTSIYEIAQFNTDAQNSEPVNDALYNRNRSIESEYNCKIKVILGGKWLDFPEKVRTLINAGDTSFNVLSDCLLNISGYSVDGLLSDFLSMEDSNLKLDGEWWDQSLIKNAAIEKHLDFLTGDITVTDNEGTQAVFFNKDLIESNGLENPYVLVKSGKWTIDKMYEMAKSVVKDDGDSQRTITGNDIWGIIAIPQSVFSYTWGFNQTASKLNSENLPELSLKSDGFLSAYKKAYSVLCDQNTTLMDRYFYSWDDPNLPLAYLNFTDGKALFDTHASIGYVNDELMRNANINYGILPYPKYDENQVDYVSPISLYENGYIAIPTTTQDYDKITYILEAMGYLGKQLVTNEYYERTLKNKRFPDNDSPDMLDLIFKNRTYDLAVIYQWGDIYIENSYNVLEKTDTIASRIDKIYAAMEVAMNKTIEKYQTTQ